MKTTHTLNTLNRLALAIGCLASGVAWAQVTVVVTPPVVVQPAPSKPVASARQQEMAVQLARANLAQQGIKEPTTAQLALATSDVQALRDSGMGWGQIANSLGLRLGSVVSAANKADKADKADQRAALDAGTTGKRPASAGSQGASGSKGTGGSGNGNGGGQGAGNGGNKGGGSNAGGGGNAGGNSGNGGKGGNSGNGGGNGGGKGGGNGGGKH